MNNEQQENELFKEKFLALVKDFPCSLGYHLQDKIDEFEYNHYLPRIDATHDSVDGMIEAIKCFGKLHPNFKILPDDDVRNMLKGFVLFDVDGS